MVRLAYSTFDKRREYEFTCDDEDGCMMWVNALVSPATRAAFCGLLRLMVLAAVANAAAVDAGACCGS